MTKGFFEIPHKMFYNTVVLVSLIPDSMTQSRTVQCRETRAAVYWLQSYCF